MKFSYKFSNLLGTIYRNGNLLFTPDGNSIISPVGNRISIYDLKNNKGRTLSLESRYDYVAMALSLDGSLLIAANEKGEAQLISMISCTVIHRHKFQNMVHSINFSPDGKQFAVSMNNFVFVFRTPGELTAEYNPFVLERHILGGFDDITWLDWSSDSRFLAMGCRDSSTRVCCIKFIKNVYTFILGGHTSAIVACFFEENSLHLNTISSNGQLCIWQCGISLSDLGEINNEKQPEIERKKQKTKTTEVDEESEDDVVNNIDKSMTDKNIDADDGSMEKGNSTENKFKLSYKKLARHYLADEPRKEDRDALVTAAHYNRSTKILIVAFNTGSFYLYEIPDVNLIHSMSISNYAISTALFNHTGDWLALASKQMGQLLVWEWQSEQYVMKQQGHSSEMTCICYSPDGQYIATGGVDSKLKLWNVKSGFCFVTFNEHTSGITDVKYSRNKKFLVSSSLDGTVRAFDTTRYRNFRTFTSPRTVQFACVALDAAGELVAAGGQDMFEIYLWSIKFGKLLEVLSGHEGPVSSLAFSPVPTLSTLVSGSWDRTIKIWNCLESNSQYETIDMLSDVTAVAFNPSGEQVAVATLNGNLTTFDVKTSAQICAIEGRNDLGSGRSEIDSVTAEKNLQGIYFSTIAYSPDGETLLAGGKSQWICIYHVREGILLKKIEITKNHSYDGLSEFLNRRNVSEFGNMALVEGREDNEGGNISIPLPGVRSGDLAMRTHRPEVKVCAVQFSPTGHSFGAACTEGLCIYSLDNGIVFDPFQLSFEITPKSVKTSLKQKEFSKALIMAVKLNETHLINLVLENIPYQEIELISNTLPSECASRLLQSIAQVLRTTAHLEFYMQWCCCLLKSHGNTDGVFQHQTLLAVHESISSKYEKLNKICDYNKFTMKMLLNVSEKQNKT